MTDPDHAAYNSRPCRRECNLCDGRALHGRAILLDALSCTSLASVPGNYINQIEQAISDAHTDPDHFMDTLFFCYGGSNGDIKVKKDCGPGKCHDSGNGQSDYCVSGLRFALVEQYAE
ncbi:hypothetical protein MVEN_00362800 [Mycena venus]|uniref:Uncharacterized protein n=1 Tax=Mycena venus TaxID=2733690 RepID=A0A8H6YTJ7_9AGAR|nr:hypothetical protein MVEN_00362800 [Mycena venus]